MPIPVDDLVKDVTFILLNHEDYDPNTDGQVRKALDAVLQELVAKTQFAAFKKYDSFATVSGTHTYAMPEDFVQCLGYGLQYAATPYTTLDWMTERDFLEGEMERNQSTGDPVRFFITHKDEDTGYWQFRVHPTPTSARTINRCYLSAPKPILLTVAAGDHVLDPRFPAAQRRGLVCGAALHFPQYLDSQTIASNQDRYLQAIKDMSNKSEPVAGNVLQKRAYGSGGRFHGMPPTVSITSIRA